MGLFVVSQTLCRIDVLPAFALPMIRTLNWTSGIRRRACWVSIGARSESERSSRLMVFLSVGADPFIDKPSPVCLCLSTSSHAITYWHRLQYCKLRHCRNYSRLVTSRSNEGDEGCRIATGGSSVLERPKRSRHLKERYLTGLCRNLLRVISPTSPTSI